MKFTNLIILLISSLPGFLLGQTIIPAGNVSGIWSLSNSPYTVQGNVTIVAGATLTIEAGVEVIVQGNYQIMVKGIIEAEGSEESPILFSKHIPGPGWEGIRFENAYSGSKLIHCIFQYGNASGGFPANVGGAIYIEGNPPEIKQCIFRYNVASYGGAIYSIASSPTIEKCVFYGNVSGNNGGAIILKGGNPKVYHCTFYDNSADGGGAIALEFCDADIQNNIFFMNDAFGAIYLDAYCDDAQIKYNDFSQNTNGSVTGYKPSGLGVINNQNNNLDPCDTYFNIFLDPLFSDFGNNDFTLTVNSPCRDAGNPILGNDPDGTLPDLGAYYLAAMPVQNIEIPAGWSGLSSYIMPSENSISGIFTQILSNIIIVQTQDAMFYPGGAVNTIQTWEPQSAYKIKLSNSATLQIMGSEETNKSFSMQAGWNLMPIIANMPVDAETLFNEINVEIVKDVAGTGLYWPEYDINTLGVFVPGKSYNVKMNEAETITFPPNTRQVENLKTPEIKVPQTPWDIKLNGPSTHTIAIPATGFNGIMPGDVIGMMDASGGCYGIAEITSLDENVAISVVSDDPYTFSKDGFISGDDMELKGYRPQNGQVFELETTFDNQQPNINQFSKNGISVITSLKVSSAGTRNLLADAINLYPNPTEGKVKVSGIGDFNQIEIYNAAGKLEQQFSLSFENEISIDLTNLSAGVYQLRFTGNKATAIKKLIRK